MRPRMKGCADRTCSVHKMKWLANCVALFCLGVVLSAHSGECRFFLATSVCEGTPSQDTQSVHDCRFRIHPHVLGQCYCKDNWRTPLLKCNHTETSCDEECMKCQGWRATGSCSPFGRRITSEDRDCDATVPSSSSGFCLCDGGRRTAFSDCRHAEFTCRERCGRLPSASCPRFDPAIRSSSATGCKGDVVLENHHSSAVGVFFVTEKGTETRLFSIAPSSRNSITHFCSPLAVRVYDEETGALLHQAVFPTASSYHIVVSSCYSEEEFVSPPSRFAVQGLTAFFEMRWGSLSAVSEPRKDSEDKHFSFVQDLPAILSAHEESFTWSRTVECPLCRRADPQRTTPCPRCNGTGVEAMAHSLHALTQSVKRVCGLCGGYGFVSREEHVCPKCGNRHYVEERVTRRAAIPEGAPEGFRVTFEGLGDQLPFHGKSDVVYTLHYAMPEQYKLRDTLLVYTHRLSLREAMRPQRFSLTTPLGRAVEYAYRPSLTSVLLRGEGVPLQGRRGRCEGFRVKRSLVKNDRRDRTCSERIPQYLDGVCLCDGREVAYNATKGGGLKTCYDPSLCGVNSRGDLLVEFVPDFSFSCPVC